MHGKGKIVFGTFGRLTNMIFEGVFIENFCANGTLKNAKGDEAVAQREGCLKVQITRGCAEVSVKFYSKSQLKKGVDKATVVYQKLGEDKIQLRNFERQKDASHFFQTLNVEEDTSAKILIVDGMIVKEHPALDWQCL